MTVDDVVINGKVLTITGDTDDTFTITTGAAGATTLATVDTAGADGILTLDADGIIKLDAGDANGQIRLLGGGTQYGSIFHSNSGANLNIKSIVSDGDMNFVGNDGGADVTALTFDMSDAGAATFNHNVKAGGYVWITTDGQKQYFGANAEISVAHVHDVGLTLANSNTGDNKPFVLQLKSEEDELEANEVIASIELAAGDNSGTDAATVAAGIHAIAEGDFTSSANPTKLVFTTGVSETAASSATAKMTLSSAGLLTIADDFIIKDGGTIGSVSDADALAIAADGVVNFTQTPTVASAAVKFAGKESIFIPAAAMYPSTTNGCAALAQVETTALRPDLKCLDFDPSSDEFAQFAVAFPKSWNEGTVTFQPFWTVTGTNTGTVAWQLGGIAVSSDDSIDTAFGTLVATNALAHSGTSNDLMVSAESGAVTIAGSPAAADQCFFQINRDVSADNQSGDARLLGIKLFFTTDAGNDA